MYWTKMNILIRTYLFPKPVFSASGSSVELLARALTRDMEKGDSKVPLGIAPPLVTLTCFEIVSEHALCPSFCILLYIGKANLLYVTLVFGARSGSPRIIARRSIFTSRRRVPTCHEATDDVKTSRLAPSFFFKQCKWQGQQLSCTATWRGMQYWLFYRLYFILD